MNTISQFSLRKRIAYALAPLIVLLLIDMVPVSHAQSVIPEKTSDVAAADSTPPSDVTNVKATGDDAAVSLSWDVATDNVGVKGYKIYYGTKSVNTSGGSYDKGPIDVGNKISYNVLNLTNNTKYYFAVTAYDAAGNESGDYSAEKSATPLHGSADKQAPKVVNVNSVDKADVRVTFSEAVQLPANHPENAFTIKNNTSNVLLEVKSAMLDASDTSNKSVLLATANQQAGAPYILTAGIDIKDISGNPIISGTSDTAGFTGTDIIPSTQQIVPAQNVQTAQTQSQQTTSAGPSLSSVQALDNSHVQVVFDKPVVLKSNASENFIITEQEVIENTLNVNSAILNPDGKTAIIATDPMKAVGYNLIAVDVVDTQGNALSVENNATVFTGIGPSTAQTQVTTQQTTQQVLDTLAPEDASNFTAAMVKQLIVTLNWTKSLNSAGDLAKYVLYMSTDGKTFGAGINVDPTANTFDVTNIMPGVKYFFKLVAMDAAGNASPGVMATFTLPKTGPELGLLLFGSFGAGKFFSGKKKNKKNKK